MIIEMDAVVDGTTHHVTWTPRSGLSHPDWWPEGDIERVSDECARRWAREQIAHALERSAMAEREQLVRDWYGGGRS